MTPAVRQRLLFAGLGLSLAATAWVASRDEAEPVAPLPQRIARPAPSTGAGNSVALPDWPGAATGARREWPELSAPARAAWGEAPPAAPLPPPPPRVATTDDGRPPAPPPPPPFGYQLVGRFADPQPRAVLTNAQRSVVAGAGEVIDGQWRVDAVEPAGLRLTYVPTGASQFVPFSSS